MSARYWLSLILIIIMQPILGIVGISQELVVYEYEPTNIYNLYEASILNDNYNQIGVATYIGNDILVVAGNDHVSLINAKDSLTLWSESIIGNAISIGADSATPTWIVVGTDSGEIVAFKSGDNRERIDYYTAQSANIIQAFIAKYQDEYRIIATVDMGAGERYVYIYEPGNPYWSEIGPITGEEPLSDISGLNIAWVAPLKVYTDYNTYYYDASRILVNLAGASEYISTLTALIYYNNTDTLTIEPALPGTRQIGDLVEVRKLAYYLLYRGGIVEQGEVGGDQENLGYQLEIEGLYPTVEYTLVVTYEIKLIDNTTNITVDSQCYYNKTQFIIQGDKLDLGQIILNPGGITRAECLEKAGVNPDNIINTNRVLTINALYAPNNIDNINSYSFKILPTPSASGFIQNDAIYDLVKPYKTPQGMDNDVKIILAVSNIDKNYVYVYALDNNFNIVNYLYENKYVQQIAVRDIVAIIKISPDGERIYIGTENGRIIMLKWISEEKRYVAMESLKIAKSSISSIEEINGKYIIVSAEDGSMQLIDINKWIPLWRGVPGYQSLKLNLDNYKIIYANSKILYGISNNKIVKFIHNSNEIQPVILNINTTIKTIQGDINKYEKDIIVYAVDENGNIVLNTTVKNEQAIIYLPTKSIDIYIKLIGVGTIKLDNVLSKFPYEEINLNIRLRQINISIYTPESIGDPYKDPGYKLVSGPQSSVNVTLVSQETKIDNYIVLSNIVSNITDNNGNLIMTVFDGVLYNGIASKEEYKQKRFTIATDGPINISIDLHPILYKIKFKIIDYDAYNHGVYYQLNGSIVISTRIDNSLRSVTVFINQSSQDYYLPKGVYNITAIVPNYYIQYYRLIIPKDTTLDIMLQALTYSTTIIPLAYDDMLKINNMILDKSKIIIKLIKPYNGTEIIAVPGEQINVRYGLYEIRVEDWVTSYTRYVWINSSEDIILTGELFKSDVNLNLFDSEINNYTINNITLKLLYKYSNYTKEVIINTDTTSITLPYGHYTIVIERIGYESSIISRNISEPRLDIIVQMNPLIVNAQFYILYNDKMTGIARGGVPSTTVKLVLVDPDVGIEYTLYGDEQGNVIGLIREGTYKIKIEGPYIETITYIISVGREAGIHRIYVEPKYAILNITVVDVEIPVKLSGVTITVNRIGPGEESTVTITSVTGMEQLLLPLGDYIVTAEMPSRYIPVSQDVRLMDDLSITIRAEPVKVTVQVFAISDGAFIEYNGINYPLPPGIVYNATIRLIPVDPLLVSLGVNPIEVKSGVNATALVQDVRAGTYMIIAIKDGYISRPITIPIMQSTSQVEAPLIPRQWSWIFMLKDNEVIEEYANIDAGILKITSYNNMPASINIRYNSGDIIMMPTGVYNITAVTEGYSGMPKIIVVMDNGNETLLLQSYRAILELDITADIAGDRQPVVFGLIETTSLDVPLKTPTIMFNVSNGKAVIEVRPGAYQLAYIIPGGDMRWELGVFNITMNYSESKIIDVNLIPVKIKLLDTEYDTDIEEASVQIDYLGPFGTRSEGIDQYRPVVADTVLLPPGIVEVRANAFGYNERVMRASVTSFTSEIVVYLNPILIPIVISFSNPDGGEIKEVMDVVLQSKVLPVEYRGEMEKSTVYFREVRLGDYELVIMPRLENSIYNTTVVDVKVTLDGVNPQSIIVEYKLFNISIIMVDEELNNPIKVPYKITIDRKGEASQQLGFPKEYEITGEAYVLLPPGEYALTIAPVNLDVYTPPPQVVFKVPQVTTVSIDMQPKKYPVTILILDDRGRSLENTLVRIQTPEGVTVAAGYTDANGQYSAQLRYGAYTVTAEKVGYLEASVGLQVPVETTKTVSLQPELITKIRRMAPLIIGMTGLLALMATIYVMRERLTRRILEEEEYF